MGITDRKKNIQIKRCQIVRYQNTTFHKLLITISLFYVPGSSVTSLPKVCVCAFHFLLSATCLTENKSQLPLGMHLVRFLAMDTEVSL